MDLRQYDQSNFDRGKPGWFVLLWWLVQAIAFPLTLHPFNGIRCQILRLFGAKVGQGVIVRPTARFTYPWKVTVGNYSWIGDDVVFYSLDEITVGEHCVISQKSYLCTGGHDIKDPKFELKTATSFNFSLKIFNAFLYSSFFSRSIFISALIDSTFTPLSV